MRILERARMARDQRKRYRRMVTEINSLSLRDLADFNGDRDDMLRGAYEVVYGRA